jgi:hypothetical protein
VLPSRPAPAATPTPPPAASTVNAANWAVPDQTSADITTAASTPIMGAASSPKVSPIVAVARARGSEGRSECQARPAVIGRVFCAQTVWGDSTAVPILR